MKQILWFRRDLRIIDNAILSNAHSEVLPIFIFDKNILNHLQKDDKRVTFIYDSVLNLKSQLQSIGLDLAIFFDEPIKVFKDLSQDFDEVLCSVDFDDYSKQRDYEVEKIIPMKRFTDSFLIDPSNHFKPDGDVYKVFTPFYKSLSFLWESQKIQENEITKSLILSSFDFRYIPSLNDIGFISQELPKFLSLNYKELFLSFRNKIDSYEHDRDYFSLDASSNLSIFLRFGIVSPVMVFNYFKSFENSEFFIRELFWREFYNYILFHNPKSQFENYNGLEISWNQNKEDFEKWCNGKTGIPIVDASMQYLNNTGLMHNRLRMIVASFLTKNLFCDWRWGEKYFASKLLDYEASSNIGSWQWSASTGADAVPYFRIFNPYTQSKKFDKNASFIKSILVKLKDIDSKLFHVENGVQSNLFISYPKAIVDIKLSRQIAIERFKRVKNE